jgi:anionic cell wall polymer biosynthesis LytR-Cps2A-Psr (LCP) family protein
MKSAYWPKTFIYITSLVFVILGACVGSTMAMQNTITVPNPLDALTKLHNLHSTKAKNTQTYLLVGVNTDTASEPTNLDSLWTISFSGKYDRVLLTGVPVTPAFEYQFVHAPESLTQSIEGLIPSSINSEFVINRKQFSWLIDELGGINIAGVKQNGTNAIQYITNHKDVNTRTARQTAVIKAMVSRAELLENSLEINQYFKHLSPEVTAMINLASIAKNIFPISSENIDITTLTTNNLTYLDDIAHTSK